MEVAEKKRKGRPSGASRLNEQDRQFLHKFSKIFLDQPQAKFATLCKVLQPDITDKNLRRLRRKWEEQKEDILKIERQKRDANAELGLWGTIAYGIEYFATGVKQILNSAPVQNIIDDIRQSHDKYKALETLGLSSQYPFDVTDPHAITSAIARLEMIEDKTIQSINKYIEPDATMDQLPQSLKYYSQALIYYELSRKAAEQEKKELEALPDINKKEEIHG